RLWERNDVQPPSMLTKTFHHPVVGELTLDCDVLHLADRDQHLVLYTAPVGSSAAESLAFLGALGADGIAAR
ncbi:MAG: transcriptional regulator, partial [Williamsia sp.]|nr:transcriptional regulator [Williamsia sp.]